jgi:hypothetical protein
LKGNRKETQMSDANVKLKATVFWSFHNKINDMSGKYMMDLGNLSDAAAKALEEIGVEVREHDEKGKFITCKSARPIRVFDNDGDEIDDEIGNGSKAKAIIGVFEWTYKNKKGKSPSIKKIVVTDLVEFASGGGGNIEDDEVL